jgi:SNF2 family DNA or RNA helicase
MMTKEKHSVREVMELLLNVCDGATSEDGEGFNKFDSTFARDLSSKDEWTYNQEKAAYKMMRKYRNQLSNIYDIDFDSVEMKKSKPSKKDKKSTKIVDYAGDGNVVVKFDYDKKLVTAVKSIPGRRWNGKDKNWEIPINSNTIPQLRSFVGSYEFEVTDKAVEEIEKRKDKSDKQINLLDNGKISIEFPYNTELVSRVKKIGKGFWNNGKKRWEFYMNLNNCEKIIKFGKEFDFEIDDEVINKCEESKKHMELSNAGDAEIDVDGFGDEELNLRPFQRAGVKYAVEKKRTFISDEMGLGKTIESLATVHKLDSYPLLVVCPATLKLNWEIEINKWIGDKEVTVIEGQTNDSIEKADVYVINYDILHHNKDLLIDIGFESIILDESHKVKNHKAKRTKAVQEIVDELDIPVRLLLTGTPIKNRPKELISQLNILDRLGDMGGFWGFAKRYCNAHQTRFGTDMDGAANLDELNKRLREKCYVRRMKNDVLSELPDKVRSEILLDIDNRNEYEDARADIIRWIEENQGSDKALKASKAEVLVRLNTLKRLTSKGKEKEVIRWIEDFLESGEKLVMFAHHVDLVKSIRDKFDALVIYGETSMKEKQRAVEEFQNNPDEQLIVISLQAGSEGITLTSASNVAFAELGWTPAEHDQAEDRCHRIGQKDFVNAWYLIARDTIDELIMDIIEEKRRIFNKSVNGGELGETKDIADEIIDILKD